MDLNLSVLVTRPGQEPVDITDEAEGLSWSSASLGGFGAASFRMAGDQRARIPHLSLLTISAWDRSLFEGTIEDVGLDITEGDISSSFEAFGLRRRLEQTSVKRIWIKRDIPWQGIQTVTGTFGGTGITFAPENINSVVAGQFDPTDLTRVGVKILATSGVATSTGATQGVWMQSDTALVRVMCDSIFNPFNDNTITRRGIRDSTDGTTWNDVLTLANSTGATSSNVTLTSGAKYLQILLTYTSGAAGANAGCEFENIRLLGTTVTEDVAGGIYGGSILRDLIPLCPDLSIGQIDAGSDFGIQQLDRSIRASMASVLEEVSTFYPVDWGVWEKGRVDWKRPNYSEPQWVVGVEDLTQLDLTATLDRVVQTVYLQYVDAVTFLGKEASASSTDQRNPYAKQGKTKDATVQVSFLMTANTAAQLAQRLALDQGSYPLIQGTLTLSRTQTVTHATQGPMPAALIRAGDNLLIPELPKKDLFALGRDGETFFHIVTSEVSEDEGTVTLGLESQQNQSDILLAKLSAATRTVTG